MLYRRYRIQLIVRIGLIIVSAVGLAYLVGWTPYYEVWVLLGLALLFQIGALLHYGEKTARDLSRFLESIRHSDFALEFTGQERGPIFARLRDNFAEVTAAFRRIRAEREVHYNYLQQVVQHAGVALFSFRAGGAVEFVNATARRLLGLGRIETVEDLRAVSTPLAEALMTLASGEQALVAVERAERTLHLVLTVNRFRLGEESYALATLHDIGDALEAKEMEAWQQLTRVLTHEIVNSVAPIASLAETAERLLDQDINAAEDASRTVLDSREAVRIIKRRSEAKPSCTSSTPTEALPGSRRRPSRCCPPRPCSTGCTAC